MLFRIVAKHRGRKREFSLKGESFIGVAAEARNLIDDFYSRSNGLTGEVWSRGVATIQDEEGRTGRL